MSDWWPELATSGPDRRPQQTPATIAAFKRWHRGPAKWRLRLGIGPSRRDLHAAVIVMQWRAARNEADMREAHVRAKTAEKQARATRREADEVIAEARAVAAAAYEPDTTTCTKTRLHTVAEAEEFAARTGAALAAEFDVYRCKVCPRHPATGQRFLHIFNRDQRFQGAAGGSAKHQRSVEAARARRRNGNVRIAESVTPADVAKLRQRFGDGKAC